LLARKFDITMVAKKTVRLYFLITLVSKLEIIENSTLTKPTSYPEKKLKFCITEIQPNHEVVYK